MPKYDLVFQPPLMNAAGSLGFAPDPRGPLDLTQMGAFITNPVSKTARNAANGTRFIKYPGGILIHSGLPNPGLRSVLRRNAQRWKNSQTPILVHIIFHHIKELNDMVAHIEGVPGVMGIELGLPPGVDAEMVRDILRSMISELPIILRIPMEKVTSLIPELSDELASGISAVSMGPPRGSLPDGTGTITHGRLYGPAVFPLTLAAVETAVQVSVPIIAGGGVYYPDQVELLLETGAVGVQLDTVLWRGNWPPS